MEPGGKSSGFSLIELLIAVGIFSILVAGVTFLVLGSFDSFYGKGNNRELARFTREAAEVIKIIKERSWSEIAALASDSPSSIKINKDGNGDWVITEGTEIRDVFTRSIYIYNVYRDGSGTIVTSGGTNDPAAKRIVVTMSSSGRSDFSVEEYVTNWEAVRMEQTSWTGVTEDNVWEQDQVDYFSSSNALMGDTVTISERL